MNYEKLNVYKSCFDLLVFIYRHTCKMQREYRYTLAEDMKRALQEVMICVYNANISRDKVKYIREARLQLTSVRILFRVGEELKQFSDKECLTFTSALADISKQLSGWERYNHQKSGDSQVCK